MPQKPNVSEAITIFPYDEGAAAKLEGKSIHENPYKAPNMTKTDDVKSDAWLKGFENAHCIKVAPI